jgi:4-hydroxybenzoate polyprenyltransferase
MIRPAIQLLRPHQWTKNGFCLAGLIFSGRLAEGHAMAAALAAATIFAAFCCASSAVYIFNDLVDVERDRRHPKKRHRPIASDRISKSVAVALMIAFAAIGLVASFATDFKSLVCVAIYLAMNVVYSLGWKHEPILDVVCIASGFVLRLLAGVFALKETPTTWIMLSTLFLSLFLGLAKRRAELASAQAAGAGEAQRPVLLAYTVPLLDSLLGCAATLTVITYTLFTVLSNKNPSLVLTVPFVFYGIFYYILLIMTRGDTEEPDRLLLRDRKLQGCIAIWLAAYIAIWYFDPTLFR